MPHYQTKYIENGRLAVESWIQINVLGKVLLYQPKKNSFID